MTRVCLREHDANAANPSPRRYVLEWENAA